MNQTPVRPMASAGADRTSSMSLWASWAVVVVGVACAGSGIAIDGAASIAVGAVVAGVGALLVVMARKFRRAHLAAANLR